MIASPWFWLGALLIVLGALGAGTRIGMKLSADDLKSYKLEVATARLTAEKEAQADHRRKELAYNAVATALQKEKEAHATLKDADRQRALAGDLRLRVPARCTESAPASAGPAERDAGAACELPRSTSAALLDIANDADEVARQLAACQQVIRSDRETK